MCAKLSHSYPTLRQPDDHNSPSSSVHGILQARILEWPPPGDLPHPGIKPVSLKSPALAGGFFTTSPTWEALYTGALATKSYLAPNVSTSEAEKPCISIFLNPKLHGQTEIKTYYKAIVIETV